MLPMGLGDVVHQGLTFHNMKLAYIGYLSTFQDSETI